MSFNPSDDLYRAVRSAFIQSGSSFNAWCAENKINRHTASKALRGLRAGKNTRAMRGEVASDRRLAVLVGFAILFIQANAAVTLFAPDEVFGDIRKRAGKLVTQTPSDFNKVSLALFANGRNCFQVLVARPDTTANVIGHRQQRCIVATVCADVSVDLARHDDAPPSLVGAFLAQQAGEAMSREFRQLAVQRAGRDLGWQTIWPGVNAKRRALGGAIFRRSRLAFSNVGGDSLPEAGFRVSLGVLPGKTA